MYVLIFTKNNTFFCRDEATVFNILNTQNGLKIYAERAENFL